MSMRSITTWTFRKDEPFALARRFADLEGTALLYSGGAHDSARASFLTLFPEEKVLVEAKPGCWEALEEALGPFDGTLPIPKWVGYFGYELGQYADTGAHIARFAAPTPDALFYRPSVVVHFDHTTHLATLYAKERVSLAPISHHLSDSSHTLSPHLVPRQGRSVSHEHCPCPAESQSTATVERFVQRSGEKWGLEREGSTGSTSLKLKFRSDTRETYCEKIAQAKEWLLAGEIYQVNLSQEFHLEGRSDPFTLFENVSLLNPAPFSAYLQCEEFALVSSSPERFLTRKGERLETRPIKGTIARGKTSREDARNRQSLMESEKERAELLMITDLMRNDLGKVSEPGSVKTRKMWRCEAYTNVFHLLSIIEGKSRLSSIPLIRALFPGGSITGCPKLRAMEAISALERCPRGVYTGSIGYLAENGDFDLNIAIRTLVVHKRHIQIQLGGAILIDSDPLKEYEETLHKGESLFNILGADAHSLF